MKGSNSLIKKIWLRMFWLANNLLWHLPRFVRSAIIGNPKQKMGLTISLTTYIERFETCFKPTLRKICELFPAEQVMVVANGHYDKARQLAYLEKLRQHCSKYPNVDLFTFVEPVCLSKLVNTIGPNSKHEKKIGMNEDMQISLWFRRFITGSGILNEDLATINNSWSHTVFDKNVGRKVGWFDERLPEMGGEDDDYAARCAVSGIKISNYNTNLIRSNSRKKGMRHTRNSWGRDMSREKGGYSSLNYDFLFNQKWETSYETFEGATYVPNRRIPYWKLREGMETPDFYPDSNYLKPGTK